MSVVLLYCRSSRCTATRALSYASINAFVICENLRNLREKYCCSKCYPVNTINQNLQSVSMNYRNKFCILVIENTNKVRTAEGI